MPVETERVTLRLPVNDLALIDVFVETGQFMNRSDVIRAAIKDFVRSRAKEVQDGLAARKALLESSDQANQLDDLQSLIAEKVRAQVEEQLRQRLK